MMRNASAILLLVLATMTHGQAPPAPAPTPAPVPVAQTLQSMQAKVQAKQFAEAVAEAEQALAIPELPGNDRARLYRAAAEALQRQKPPQIPAAIAMYERALADAAVPTSARLEALKQIADLQVADLAGRELSDMDLSAAEATLQRGLGLPDLKPNDRATALKHIAALLQRQDRHEEARSTLEQITALEVSEGVKQEARRLIATVLIDEGRGDEAEKLYLAAGGDAIELYRLLDRPQQRQAACERVLNDTAIPEAARWTAFTKLPCWDHRARDLAAARALSERYLPAFIESDPNRALVLQRKFNDIAVKSDPAFVVWAGPILLGAPRLSDNDYTAVQAARVEALAALNQRAQAVEVASAVAADQRVTPAVRLWAQVVGVALAGDGDPMPLLEKAEGLDAAARAGALVDAARTALRAGDEPAARRLYGRYEAMLNEAQRASVQCAFLAGAPFDVGSWLASPLLREAGARLDRPYGDNLEFLLQTDSAMTGRNTTAAGAAATGDTETDFRAACDVDGIHLFFHARDARAAEVLAGLVGGGSFEMYLAAGDGQPYHTFLIDMPRGGVNPQGFITQYPNAAFRLPSLEAGTIRTQTRPTEAGFATHLFLAWELFHDRLPANGDRWQFEAIRWTRSGGFSFGGSKSVHNRSSWGDIVFDNLGPEQLTAIKRSIIFKAVHRYKQARGITGALGHWADAELGDPAFYEAVVAPMIQRLDAQAARVNKDMTAAEVESIYREAVGPWMEAQHYVSALRSQYLHDRHLAR